MKFIIINLKYWCGIKTTIFPLRDLVHLRFDKAPKLLEIKFLTESFSQEFIDFDLCAFEEFLSSHDKVFKIHFDDTAFDRDD